MFEHHEPRSAAGGGYGPPGGGAPGGWGPPPGGAPPGGGWGPPPGGAPPGGYGSPPGDPFGPPPGAGPGGFGPPPGAMVHAPYGVHPITGVPFSDKSKVVAGLLQIFVPFGVGRFYTGHTKLGAIQAAAVVLTCGFAALWPLVDGVLMLMGNVTDSDGRPLRDGV